MSAWPISAAVVVLVGVVWMMPRPAASHGYLFNPPSRSSVWRHPQWARYVHRNNDDNGLNCGGLKNEKAHGYKCGICGDPVQQHPRHNEVGGRYANPRWRPITANYTQGQEIEVTVVLTAHHLGWMSIKLCPTNDFSVKATQKCLDMHQARLPNGQLHFKMMPVKKLYKVKFVLPRHLTCDLCVLQWRYHAGNTWGRDPRTHRWGQGLGMQEEFYGCADVSISPDAGQEVTSPAQEVTTPQVKSTTEKHVTDEPTTISTPDSAIHKSTTTDTTTDVTTPAMNVLSLCRDYHLDDGLHVDPTSCRHFLQCDDLHTSRQACPHGTGFSPRYRTCDQDFIC